MIKALRPWVIDNNVYQLPKALSIRSSSDCSTEMRDYADMFNQMWTRW
jgi:hypothetical protein